MSETARIEPEAFWTQVHYGADGLVPVVVQSAVDGRVLMLAYANAEALARTAAERRAWFWSRSRQALWRKGDVSGNAMEVQQVRWDCDADALLYLVLPHGPACHTGEQTCFYRGEAAAAPPAWSQPDPAEQTPTLGACVDGLLVVIAERAAAMPAGSYVADVLRSGPRRALQKLGEEAVETVIAGLGADQALAVGEFADLVFASAVALVACGIDAQAVAAELARRHSVRPPRA